MVTVDPTTYFGRLHELLTNTEVTDRQKTRISLAAGVQAATHLVTGSTAPAGYKVMLVGNGGSAAIVSHMQNDICKAVGVPAIVFNEPPLLTALTNDDGYTVAFERLVDLWGKPGDILVAVSSSGASENIVRAVRCASERQCRVLSFSGFSAANPLRTLGDLNFYVASNEYGFVEVAHTALGHLITDMATAAVKGRGRHGA